VASIFMVEEKAKQETSETVGFLLGFLFSP
jgi:hypothetical protein